MERRSKTDQDAHDSALNLLESVFQNYSATEIAAGMNTSQYVRLIIGGALSRLTFEEIDRLTGQPQPPIKV